MFIKLLLFLTLMTLNIGFLIYIRKKIHLYNPAHLFLLYWIVNIILGVIVFVNQTSWNFIGLVFLLLSVDAFVGGFYLAIGKREQVIASTNNKWYEKKIFTIIILTACFISGMIYEYLELKNNGFSFLDLTSWSKIIKVSSYFSSGRYGTKEHIVVTTIEQIFLTVNYSGFVFCGLVCRLGTIKKRYSIILFIPMVICLIATTAKTPFICAAFLWITGYLLGYNTTSIVVEKTERKKTIIKFAVIGLSVVALLFLSFAIRYKGVNFKGIINRILVYSLGHVPCYDGWFADFDGNLFGYSHGEQSFMAIMGEQMPNALREVYISPKFVSSYSWTNVITMFAFTIMDFGYIGNILFYLGFGAIAGLSYMGVRRRNNAFAYIGLGMTIFIILYSFIISPLKYMSIIGAFVLLGIYIFTLQHINIGRKNE